MNIQNSVDSALQYMNSGQEEKCASTLKYIYNNVVDNINQTKSHYDFREAYLLSNTFNVMQVKIKDDVDMQLLTEFGFMLASTIEAFTGGIGGEAMHLRSTILAMTIRGGRNIKKAIVKLFNDGVFKPVSIQNNINNYLIVETYFLALAYYHYTRHERDEIILSFYTRWGGVIESTFSSPPYKMQLIEVAELGKKVHDALYKYLSSKYKIQIGY
jgi:hypothetical protein